VRIAFIDALSGPFAATGENALNSYRYAIDELTARGRLQSGTKFEVVPFDSKGSPDAAVVALQRAIAQGMHYITQGLGSNVALALVEAVGEHNAHHPQDAVVLLNYGSNDPALTNERCSFWHFRFDADADVRMAALTDAIAADKGVRKVYLINQDYSAGRAVARTARTMLVQKRPDIAIVGDDLHPLGTVTDFAPYVERIRQSGADAVITQDWGADLTGLLKATDAAGVKADYYTFYASGPGVLAALGSNFQGRIKEVSAYNPTDEQGNEYLAGYRKKFGVNPDVRPRIVVGMLAQAIAQTHSHDPIQVARALEGMTYDDLYGRDQMRAENHQLSQPLFVNTADKPTQDSSNGDKAWRVERRIEAQQLVMPTSCRMQRPG
jgi:branched-chain amino acid transport system substrate-binding protein